MPITPDHAGTTYAPTAPYEVTRGAIEAFAKALGDDTRAEATLPVAPPTFGIVVVGPAWDALFADPGLDLSLSRIVHAEQQFRYLRPLEPGDVVTATLTVDKVRVRGSAEFISTSVEVRDELDQPVLTTSTTFVHTREAAA